MKNERDYLVFFIYLGMHFLVYTWHVHNFVGDEKMTIIIVRHRCKKCGNHQEVRYDDHNKYETREKITRAMRCGKCLTLNLERVL